MTALDDRPGDVPRETRAAGRGPEIGAAYSRGHQDGYADGYVAHAAKAGTGDCRVPVPLYWRYVQAGDTIVGLDGKDWHVTAIGPDQWGRARVTAVNADDVVSRPASTSEPGIDPDAPVTVLVRVDERDALATHREILGARVIARRINGETDLLPQGDS